MEERREDEYTEYTGEYGNAIQGEYQEDTTYRYSYQNGDESTHSGDYYASAGEHTAKEEASSPGENPTPSQGDSGFPGQPPIPPAGAGYYGQVTPPPKKPATFGMKLLVTAACAVVFGLVAGVVFHGYEYVSGKLGAFGRDGGRIEKTQVNSRNQGEQKEQKTAASGQPDKKDVAAITEQTMPAVVAITSTTQGGDYYDLFGQYYQGRESTSSGSGFIVGQSDKELLIATNNHVVDNAKTISVQFIDGEIYEAKEKGADSSNDLAVIAVNLSSVKKPTMDKIKIADLGNSDKAKVGEMVIAIGNALGYGQSVTVGYISAKDREITETQESGGTAKKIKALQTDAAINPGNSGGALINMQGQVIGINSAKIASSAVEGVGYAIPISVATPIIDELKNKEILTDDEKGYLGISGTEVTQQASVYNMPYGVYVKEVAKGGAAEKAGIKAGDVITAVNKSEVTTMQSLQEKVNNYRKGTKVTVTIRRSNNGTYQEKKLTVQLQGKESLESLPDQGNDNSDNNGNNGSGNNGNNGGNGNDGSNDGNNGSGNGNDIFGGNDDFGSLWDFFR